MNISSRKYTLINCRSFPVICPEPVTIIVMPPFRRQVGKACIRHGIIKHTPVIPDLLLLCVLHMFRYLEIVCARLVRKSIESASHGKFPVLRIQNRQVNGSARGMCRRHIFVRNRIRNKLTDHSFSLCFRFIFQCEIPNDIRRVFFKKFMLQLKRSPGIPDTEPVAHGEIARCCT